MGFVTVEHRRWIWNAIQNALNRENLNVNSS